MRVLVPILLLATGLVASGAWMEYRDFLAAPLVPEQASPYCWTWSRAPPCAG